MWGFLVNSLYYYLVIHTVFKLEYYYRLALLCFKL